MSELSNKQQQILEYMKAEVRDKGYPPSVREICDAVGLKSTSTVHGHLSRLEKKGLIRRDPTKPRAIEILDPGFEAPQKELVNVPIVGTITAVDAFLGACLGISTKNYQEEEHES